MAKRHTTSRRRPGERQSEPDDVFVAKVFELSKFAEKHSQALILVGIALALVVAGVVYYVNFRSQLVDRATAELEQIQVTVASGDAAAGRAQLERYLQDYGATPTAQEARLLLAQLHLSQNQPEDAVEVLREADAAISEPLGPQLLTMLAKAYEESGRTSEAERQYLSVAESSPMQFQRLEALSGAARMRSIQGDHAGAADVYEEILDELDEAHPDRGLYQMRLAEARHEARS